ncbi:outer membrane protein assembly factor BamE [Oceanospirillum sediminis]|nr:outer membrane protein assembly factor BamE [Oceanospirillum sediminis]
MTEEMINQLKPGLTREQVAYVMGTPLTTSTFNKNRWDYVYWLKDPRDNVTRERVTLFFEQDTLNDIIRVPEKSDQ